MSPLVRYLSLVLVLAGFTFAKPIFAIDVLDLFNVTSSFSLRADGYRSYRLKTELDDGRQCIVGLTAHVLPTVEKSTVLFMGMGSDRWNWKPFIQSFEGQPEETSFIAIDWPHHGDTDCPVEELEDVAKVLHKILVQFGRPVERFVGASLGVLPAAYMQDYYPEAKQLWLTPPMMTEDRLPGLLDRILGIQEPVHVQSFLNEVLTEPIDIPNFVLKAILKRIQRSHAIVRALDVQKVYKKVLSNPPKDLRVILGAQDRLFPVDTLSPKLKTLTQYPIETVPCGHDVVSRCTSELKELYQK